jgi:prepilin-type N-terminal cleavage/methylation domain-containing protein/prepilin-type processing-associated H-X9-DG protein
MLWIMRSKQGPAGFTMVELLVVISVIAILASLLLPSLATAKAKAQAAQCKSNLRHIAIAQALYVTDFDAYPFSEFGDWFSLLGSYGAEIGPDFYYQDEPLLWCPSARYGGPETKHQFWDYGYNAFGFTPQLMGQQALMGLDDNWSPDDPSNKPVREVDVLNPCNMIAFSDSAAKFPGEKKLTLGLAWIGTVGQTAPGIPNGTALAYQRHAKKFNTSFADSHVESLKLDTLFFSTEDQDRRR